MVNYFQIYQYYENIGQNYLCSGGTCCCCTIFRIIFSCSASVMTRILRSEITFKSLCKILFCSLNFWKVNCSLYIFIYCCLSELDFSSISKTLSFCSLMLMILANCSLIFLFILAFFYSNGACRTTNILIF